MKNILSALTRRSRATKLLLLFCAGALAFTGICFAWRTALDTGFASERPLPPPASKRQPGSALSVGILGDSWASGGDGSVLPVTLEQELRERGISAQVRMFGHPGAKTKQIYKDLFKNPDEAFSAAPLLTDPPEYCFILAGTNDFCSEMGGEFYARHMRMIADALARSGAVPLILELPNLDLARYDAHQAKDGLKNVLRQVRNRIRGGGRDRAAYVAVLETEILKMGGGIKIIPFALLSSGFDGELRTKDGIHLTPDAKKHLAKIFADALESDIKEEKRALCPKTL